MSDKERYDVLLKELAEILKQKNDTIYFQNIEIENLKKKLAEVEKQHKSIKLEIRKEGK